MGPILRARGNERNLRPQSYGAPTDEQAASGIYRNAACMEILSAVVSKQLFNQATEEGVLHRVELVVDLGLATTLDLGEQFRGDVEFGQLGRDGAINLHRAFLHRSGRDR